VTTLDDTTLRFYQMLLSYITSELTTHGVMFFASLTAATTFLKIIYDNYKKEMGKGLLGAYLIIQTFFSSLTMYLLWRIIYYGYFINHINQEPTPNHIDYNAFYIHFSNITYVEADPVSKYILSFNYNPITNLIIRFTIFLFIGFIFSLLLLTPLFLKEKSSREGEDLKIKPTKNRSSNSNNQSKIMIQLNTRENSTLVFSTVASSASLIILTYTNPSPTNNTNINLIGILFIIFGFMYREITIFYFDIFDYNKLHDKPNYSKIWIFIHMFIIRAFLLLPLVIYSIGPFSLVIIFIISGIISLFECWKRSYFSISSLFHFFDGILPASWKRFKP
jgi:hypothetical protein